ncbi:MAG TPA: sugar nucleotide-binding protein [Rhodothermales bacterium]|nr:sugar nucleotide-binding protein [Rhodothermales bacterium]
MKALLTGASGTVGTALTRHLHNKGHEVVRWDRASALPDDYAAMERFVRAVAPDVLFHLAIASQPTGRAQESHLVNVHWPSELAWLTRQLGVRFVATSSVMVFSDDAHGPFTVASIPDAQEGYGAEKKEAEARVFAQNPEARVVRLGWQIGTDPDDGGNHMAAWAEAQMQAHGQVEASTRWLPACSFLDDTAAALVSAAERRPGLYLVDSNDGWTFYDVACALAARLERPWRVVPTHAFVFNQRMRDPRLGVASLAARLPTLGPGRANIVRSDD